jgi:hypothetical protein
MGKGESPSPFVFQAGRNVNDGVLAGEAVATGVGPTQIAVAIRSEVSSIP